MPSYNAIYVCQNRSGGPSLFTPSSGHVCSNPPEHYESFLMHYVPEEVMKDIATHPLRNEAPPKYNTIKGTPDGKPLSAQQMMLLYAAIALHQKK